MNIAPLLDVMLVQALSKRTPAPQPALTEPVAPSASSQLVREVHSDSRLNDGPNQYNRWATEFATPQRPLKPSTIITLDRAAKTIADILLRYPQALPLLTMSGAMARASATPAALGHLMLQSLTNSGLFFESHLARWYRGDYPLELLQKDPKVAIQGNTSLHGARDTSLSGEDRSIWIMRHQLELIAAPGLRFEGSLLQGLPIMIQVQVLPGVDCIEQVADESDPDSPTQSVVELVVRIEHPRFEIAEFILIQSGERLEITLRTPSQALLEYYRRDSQRICSALQDLGYHFSHLVRQHSPKSSFAALPWVGKRSSDNCIENRNLDLGHAYGSPSDRIILAANEQGIDLPPYAELLDLLIHCDLDSKIPVKLMRAVGLLNIWVFDQLEFLS